MYSIVIFFHFSENININKNSKTFSFLINNYFHLENRIRNNNKNIIILLSFSQYRVLNFIIKQTLW